jgi:16S rRNA (cytosine1402-N4)-methyltransferase
LQNLIANGRLLCLDRDSAAIADARSRFAADPRVAIFLAPFSSLAQCADQVEPGLKFDGILFDLGVSSPQLDDAARGFSFMQDGPLDMRMTAGVGASAADVVNGAPVSELIRIFREYGEERLAPRIARAIVKDRESQPFETTLQLAEMIARVAHSKERHKHPATRVFQALRIAVNAELAELEQGLDAAERLLGAGGRLAVVTFHSLEDRIVKAFFTERAGRTPGGSRHLPPQAGGPRPTFSLLFNGARAPGEAEIAANPRARSAKLRAGVRTDAPAWRAAA